ncbi:MAG: hypothetical protein SFU56_01985 [Capsulimonadales bacterium]|nr:hypothetical protein [Capsulimonadales bacterium]
MNLFDRIRAFAQFIRTEFTMVDEQKVSSGQAAPARPALPESLALNPPKTNTFVPPGFLNQLPKMTRTKIDSLDFGCVRVSDNGIVEIYNKWEADFAGVDQKAAIGRNFFRELAPCTNNRLIFGRFKEGVKQDELNTIITYAFTYKMRPTLVRVHLYRDPDTRTNWVLVQKHESAQGK